MTPSPSPDTPSPAGPPEVAQVQVVQGRLQLLAALGVILLLVAALPLSRWLHGDFSKAGAEALPLAVTLVVLYFTYRGQEVARYVTLFLSVLGGLALALLSGLLAAWLPTLVGLVFALSGIAIATLPDIQVFLTAQREAARRSAGRGAQKGQP